MNVPASESHVLVVEDNADNLFIVMDLLKEEVGVGYCNARASGQMFFALLRSSPSLRVDLVLLDLQIPREDGYTVLKQIRATPRLAETKVVALTANVLPEEVRRMRAAGFDGLIGKPLNIGSFPEQINRILAGEAVWSASS